MCLNLTSINILIYQYIRKMKKAIKQIINQWVSSQICLSLQKNKRSTIIWLFPFYSFTKARKFSWRSQCPAWLYGYARATQRIKRQREQIWALFTDLSKAFNCIVHYLLITKLFWYTLTNKTLNPILLCLGNQTKGLTTNNSYNKKY